MTQYQVKPYSNIAKIGLNKLEGTECTLNENSDSPDGILIRSTRLAKDLSLIHISEPTRPY